MGYFADKENLKIKTKLLDLSNDNIAYDLGKFEAIIVNHYRLNPALYKVLASHLEDGGVLWINGFREVPRDNKNITENDIFTEEDFCYMNGMKCVDKRMYEVNGRKFIRSIWKK